MRMTAALRLGKQKGLNKHRHKAVREALERALKDPSASVRASAAAALQRFGDPRALPALRSAQTDSAENVVRQIERAVSELEKLPPGPSYVVEVRKVRVNDRVGVKSLNRHVKRVARKNLSRVPGVVMKSRADDEAEALPNLVFDGMLRKLDERREGKSFAVSAQVEFVISRMPGHIIKGRISGGATVHGDSTASKREAERGRLRREAVEAATESALTNAKQALQAASR